MTVSEHHRDINDDVVRGLYEAAAGLISWTDALGHLHREMQCAGVQLVVVDKPSRRLLMSEQSISEMVPINVDGVLDHVREYHQHDPHMIHTASLPVGEVMHSAAAFPIEKWVDHVFYREYWSAYGVREIFAAKLAEDDRHLAMIGMTRTKEMPPYSAEDNKLFSRYINHLATAYRIVQHLGVVQATAQAGIALIEASSRPTILMDPNKVILARNESARRLLRDRHVICEVNGRLDCRTTEAKSNLQNALSKLDLDESQSHERNKKKRVAARLAALSSETLLCTLWGMKPASTMGAFGARPVVLLTVATSLPGELDPMYFASMFDLSPAEARIAVALAAGLTLRAAAAKYVVSLETVRTQLKSIFTKTQTRRQADLVSLLRQSLA